MMGSSREAAMTGFASLGARALLVCSLGSVAVLGNPVGPLDHSFETAPNAQGHLQGGAPNHVVSDGYGACALLVSGNVDCWGWGLDGELGNGQYATKSSVPVEVVNTDGKGALSGVRSLATDGPMYGQQIGPQGQSDPGSTFCAVLSSGHVDCWGFDEYGELGNGDNASLGFGDAVPSEVVSTTGKGALAGVQSLTSAAFGGDYGFCALLVTHRVDCWGDNVNGELGDGNIVGAAAAFSATPVPVVGTNGKGTLDDVVSVAAVTDVGDTAFGDASYCALLTSHKVDCWGYGANGQLGDHRLWVQSGPFSVSGSPIPVRVVATSGRGLLSGVESFATDGAGTPYGDCVVLTTRRVDCWGQGNDGQLGNGRFYTSGQYGVDGYGSSVPVAVTSTKGTGTLTSVRSVSVDTTTDCAVLISGAVDCWGLGVGGQLGNGKLYESGVQGSAVPVAVVSTGGTGELTGVSSVADDGTGTCALLSRGHVDCWGNDSPAPAAVVSTGGTGELSGVASLSVEPVSYVLLGQAAGTCALLTAGTVVCWGSNPYGELGAGSYVGSGPVAVVSTSGTGELAGV